MKKILVLFFLAGFLYACDKGGETTTENPENTESVVTNDEVVEEESEEASEDFPDPDAVGSFGDEISAEGAIDGNEVVAQLASLDSVQTKVRGTISSCCQAKGCWMTMPIEGEKEMMVKFKDYSFFVPKNSSG